MPPPPRFNAACPPSPDAGAIHLNSRCGNDVPNLDGYHCLWHLDCRWDAFGLGVHGTTFRHCGFDQPLPSNSRFQNRVAEPGERALPCVKQRAGNGRSTIPFPCPVVASSLPSRTPRTISRSFPRAEQDLEEWQAAVEALLLVVELNGPTMMARIGVMRGLNRHVERMFNTDRKDKHWGKRKIKRDE